MIDLLIQILVFCFDFAIFTLSFKPILLISILKNLFESRLSHLRFLIEIIVGMVLCLAETDCNVLIIGIIVRNHLTILVASPLN